MCSQMLAAIPYYIDEASLHVYSMEELSYYILHNVYLLEADFMNEELCAWIEHEGRQKDLAERLREILRKDGTLLEFVTCILNRTGYCDREEIKQVTSALAGLMNKSEYECRKIRADRYAANGRYASAISEYRRLLDTEEKNEILIGSVWHNMGTAYARGPQTAFSVPTRRTRIPSLSGNVFMHTAVCAMRRALRRHRSFAGLLGRKRRKSAGNFPKSAGWTASERSGRSLTNSLKQAIRANFMSL